MITGNFNADKTYNPERISTKVILDDDFTKEIRILMAKGQEMKAHKAPFPIQVHVLEGEIDFEVNNETMTMTAGEIISLEASVIHALFAKENSMIRLSLNKSDRVERVNRVANN